MPSNPGRELGPMIYLAKSPFLQETEEQMAERLLWEALRMYAPRREGVTTLGDLAMEIARVHPSVDLFEAMNLVAAFFHCLAEAIGEGGADLRMDPEDFLLINLRDGEAGGGA